jgi:hypothetical protein
MGPHRSRTLSFLHQPNLGNSRSCAFARRGGHRCDRQTRCSQEADPAPVLTQRGRFAPGRPRDFTRSFVPDFSGNYGVSESAEPSTEGELMGWLILVLVVLAIVALGLYILRGSRTRI